MNENDNTTNNIHNQVIRFPDYRLSRMTDTLDGAYVEYRAFNMYITSRDRLDNKRKIISGTTEDHLGIADFVGVLSDELFMISVSYRQEAIDHGAPEEFTLYIGEKIKDAYIGNFVLTPYSQLALTSNYIPDDFSASNYKFGAKKFDIEKFSKINPDLKISSKPVVIKRKQLTYIEDM